MSAPPPPPPPYYPMVVPPLKVGRVPDEMKEKKHAENLPFPPNTPQVILRVTEPPTVVKPVPKPPTKP
ncbi:hypothetical protein LINGRAHAP2_LOCUS12394 [Linum grandiflorum]